MTTRSQIVWELRGYAVPFNRIACVGDDGHLERFERTAFSAMLDHQHPSVSLRFQGHDAESPTLAPRVALFADSYGLGFSAHVVLQDRQWSPSPHWARVKSIISRRDPADQCSVGGLRILASRKDRSKTGVVDVVLKATIDHISITPRAAYGTGTGCWPAHLVDDDAAPWRLREMAAQWDVGFRNFSADQVRASADRRRPIGRTVSGDIVMVAPSGMLSLKRRRSARCV